VALSCDIAQSTATAREAVDLFHSRYNAREFAQIYTEADEAFKASTTQADLLALMDAFQRKLGEHRGSTPAGTHVSAGVSGTQVTMAFHSEYAEGHAAEQFVLRIHDQRATLISFNISSPVLVLK
jgi:hypothetical protein